MSPSNAAAVLAASVRGKPRGCDVRGAAARCMWIRSRSSTAASSRSTGKTKVRDAARVECGDHCGDGSGLRQCGRAIHRRRQHRARVGSAQLHLGMDEHHAQGLEDATLDLQAVLATAYDRAGYDLRVDYSKEPTVPLSGEGAAWASEVARSRPAT